MLFQKCSDVFNVEKCGSIFVVSHAVSRHENCGDFVFKLDEDAIPLDGTSDRQQQLEVRRNDERNKMIGQISLCLEDATVALKRSDIINLIKEKLELGTTRAYQLFNEAITAGVLATNDKKHYFLKTK